MLITVFTPSYNRAHLLPRLYDSLCRQTCKDFEWVIVDDGSTDDTRQVVEDIVKKNDDTPDIRYYYKENGGKHSAINVGVQEAKGELFLILDSDDSLPVNALEMIQSAYSQIKQDKYYGGLCCCMAHHDGTPIGNGTSCAPVDADEIMLRYHHHVTGDLCEVFLTEVMKKFPFPMIEGERFCPEQLIWYRIAKHYILRFLPETVYFRDYLEGGLTDKIVRIRMHSPIASMMTYAEMTQYPKVPLMQKVKAAVNYWRFWLCANKQQWNAEITDTVWRKPPTLRWWWNMMLPMGWLMHLKDRKQNMET